MSLAGFQELDTMKRSAAKSKDSQKKKKILGTVVPNPNPALSEADLTHHSRPRGGGGRARSFFFRTGLTL